MWICLLELPRTHGTSVTSNIRVGTELTTMRTTGNCLLTNSTPIICSSIRRIELNSSTTRSTWDELRFSVRPASWTLPNTLSTKRTLFRLSRLMLASTIWPPSSKTNRILSIYIKYIQAFNFLKLWINFKSFGFFKDYYLRITAPTYNRLGWRLDIDDANLMYIFFILFVKFENFL